MSLHLTFDLNLKLKRIYVESQLKYELILDLSSHQMRLITAGTDSL